MNNKKVDQEERADEMKRRLELEKLIQETASNLSVATQEASRVLPHQNSLSLNYYEVKQVIDKDSTEIVRSIAEFYLDTEIIDTVPYVKQKTKVDHITVSSLLFQMKTAEHAIIKLLAEIDSGNLHPRTFEVLASLQRSKMEIVKHLAQFMIIMENAYKNFKEDYRIKKAENTNEEESQEDDDGIRTRGTRQLLKTLAKIKKDQDGGNEFNGKFGSDFGRDSDIEEITDDTFPENYDLDDGEA
jgi:hypothetical protein